MAHQYIFTMQNLRRVHPPNKEVLKGIFLSFYPGAKIGVLGSNGAGKSTLLRIMAGVDTDFFGEAKPADGIKIGYLPQEPQLDPDQGRAAATSRRRWPRPRALLKRFDEVNMRLGEDLKPEEMEKLLDEQAKLQDAIEAANALGPRPHAGDRHGRAAPAAGRRRRHQALGRRAPARRAVQDPAAAARSAAARRADQPSRRRERGLARALPARVPGHRRGRDPRSLLPGQRGRLDPGARPRRRHPLGGELHLLAGAEAEAAGAGGEGRVGAAAHAGARAGVGARLAARAPGQEQGPPGGLRADAGRGAAASAKTRWRSAFRPGRVWATWWSRPRTCPKATATAADRGPDLQPAARRHRRA